MRYRDLVSLKAGVLASAAIGLAERAPSAQADFASSDYSFTGGTCTNRVDPVTLVFIGDGAYVGTHGYSERVWDLLNGMADSQHNWRNANGSAQYASSHGVCTEMERQSASGDGAPRYHIRLNQTHHRDLNNHFEAVGTPHYEVDTFCGHAVPPDSATAGDGSGFVLARGHIKNDWLSAYGSGKLFRSDYWGNTEPQQQCNGWYAANSDGIVYWLETN